jgi:hypothetical protein
VSSHNKNQQPQKHMSDTPPQVPSSGAQSAVCTEFKRLDAIREREEVSRSRAISLLGSRSAFGAHRLYMGRPHGVTMLIITLVSIPLCLVLIGFFSLFPV